MRRVQQLGIVLFLVGLFTFSSTVFVGHFSPNKSQLTALMAEKGISSKVFESKAMEALTNRSFKNINALKTALTVVIESTNDTHRAAAKRKGPLKRKERKPMDLSYTALQRTWHLFWEKRRPKAWSQKTACYFSGVVLD